MATAHLVTLLGLIVSQQISQKDLPYKVQHRVMYLTNQLIKMCDYNFGRFC